MLDEDRYRNRKPDHPDTRLPREGQREREEDQPWIEVLEAAMDGLR